MTSNLPPGVTVSMIPGNRPEDGLLEAAEEWLMDELASANLRPDEYETVARVGLEAVKHQRKAVHEAVHAAIQEERIGQEAANLVDEADD
ncbi:MAG TPA: hypothetical protein VMY37_04395 [Thermoguttaceae bacterium]|nr:hypothetical protein [Thermoguttaceae bacterium]